MPKEPQPLSIETDDEVVELTRTQLRERVRTELAGHDLVTELLMERRNAAAEEDRF